MTRVPQASGAWASRGILSLEQESQSMKGTNVQSDIGAAFNFTNNIQKSTIQHRKSEVRKIENCESRGNTQHPASFAD
eukprot:scaffold175084_cov37-Prasinocladus_malaysianus.AAC.1